MTLLPVGKLDVDVAIVGSGFSGSLTALALLKRGTRVALIERGRHPRFAIGESSTPLANLMLEELADRYDLPRLRAFSQWGSWQRTHPDVAVGLKRGFSFYFHETGDRFADPDDRGRQLLVAASPTDEVSDTHWYRPDFDHALVKEADAAGAIHLDQTTIHRVQDEGSGWLLDAEREGRTVRIRAGFVIDASGPRGFLHRMWQLGDTPPRWLPRTHAIYSHFEGVERWDRIRPSADPPPYPPDDAAVHHVFDGGWIWILRFNNGLTSAGAALTDARAAGIVAAEGEVGWRRLLDRLPAVKEQFDPARAVLPFVYSPRLFFRSARVSGPAWALLPSAAGIVDPLLSTGFALTLSGIQRLLDVLEQTSPGPERTAALRDYERITLDELEVVERLVAALYAAMDDPHLFKRLGRLYFAAASFSEAARRLGRPELAPGFLLSAHPTFGPELKACTLSALSAPRGEARRELQSRIDRAIEPFDTIGLLDERRRDWYPVLAEDLLTSAPKLHATRVEIEDLLERSGVAVTGGPGGGGRL